MSCYFVDFLPTLTKNGNTASIPHRNLTLVKKIGSKILVSGSDSITNLNRTPTFEYCVGLGVHLRTPKWHHVFNRDWTLCSKSVKLF